MNVETQNSIKQAGFQDGVAWRDGSATKGQLTRLRRFNAERPDFEAWFEAAEECRDETAPTALARIINPKLPAPTCRDPDPVGQFWDEVGGRRRRH